MVRGGYAVVGGAAAVAGATGTVSAAVITFEVTSQLSYMLPVLLAVRRGRKEERDLWSKTFLSLLFSLFSTIHKHNIHQHLQVLVGRTSGRLFSRPIFQALATKIGLKRDPMMVFILYLCVTEYFTTLMILLND